MGHVYDWDAMSMEGNFSQAGRGQVARLLMDLGIMSQMDYNPSGSGAASISPIKLATYFEGRSAGLHWIAQSYFKKHRIGSRRGRGFLPDDLKEIKKAR